MKKLKFIISGGGTGGHVFPAISIANALKRRVPDADFLFVGAEGRMEMEKVPAAGYAIKGLPVSGFDRKNILNNIKVLVRLFKSITMAKKIVREFAPDAVIGVGGYASGPTLYAANGQGVPTFLQEQNSYAGVTNKLLAKNAAKICVAYEGMEKFFPKEKIILTGNPVRQDFLEVAPKAEEAYKFFNFDPSKKTLLIIGGSLGARTINQSVLKGLPQLKAAGIQVLWQTGKYYFENMKQQAAPYIDENLLVTDFVKRMDYAYAIADLVISRAGASSISELCLLGKPSILVPSPNVAEDHQTKNAMALASRDAAVMITDADAPAKLADTAVGLIADGQKLSAISANAKAMAQLDSADRIATEILSLVTKE
ncbi:MAG TPA: undecaprenyldiphospho-muramoylpentapeptide beta-N-acetylglucosaminyltransferase [Paludibacteraceae bacterium]|jgi:UDP-N-acetylglucosamine--N-acetylmuramyl-(pentapeptide) pyrophosphoryl-undecaprenol N-acetylglucosamine transferase|nr:undecaprenyldiphospho-muramoylpentapeptide beta-N-acetylglucosaminyltransferase [Paludibacteraceae bacterium]HPH62366.1 undecaprenyldiphospho-muramoylpentapeptide beta-N-acetylglucosaminyltransferase [Paludibacteraceae bacterium]